MTKYGTIKLELQTGFNRIIKQVRKENNQFIQPKGDFRQVIDLELHLNSIFDGPLILLVQDCVQNGIMRIDVKGSRSPGSLDFADILTYGLFLTTIQQINDCLELMQMLMGHTALILIALV